MDSLNPVSNWDLNIRDDPAAFVPPYWSPLTLHSGGRARLVINIFTNV